MIWPQSPRQQTLRELYAFNLTEEQLRERFIEPHDEGRPITWGGRTLPAGDLDYIRVAFTEESLNEEWVRRNYQEYEAFTSGVTVTNDWVTRAPGSAAAAPSANSDAPPVVQAIALCRRFDVVRRQLLRRHANRPTLEVNDEFDVQDLMHALLLVHFEDVRAESWNPNYLGGASRVDFLVPASGFIVEVKKTRNGLLDRQVGAELAEDVTRYSDPAANRGAGTLVCFVHDPDHLLANPAGLENDLAQASNERLKVIGVVA
jgi:hypothetical protein